MKKQDPKTVRIFEAKLMALLNDLQRLYKQGKLSAAAGLMADETTLVLLKSQRTYQGKKQIYAFLKEMRRRGILEIRLTVQKKRVSPIDMLVAEDSAKGLYWGYDLEAVFLGSCEFKSPGKTMIKVKSLIYARHIKVCIPIVPFFILDF